MSHRARRQFPSGHIVTLMSTDVETFHQVSMAVDYIDFLGAQYRISERVVVLVTVKLPK